MSFMNIQKNVVLSILLGAACILLGAADTMGGQACVGTSPYVCAKRTGQVLVGVNVTFDLTDPDNPDVALKSGASDWLVWSQVSSTDTKVYDLGDLTLAPSGADEDFAVSILNPVTVSTGAANIKSIVLSASSWSGHSRLAGVVTGDLSGDLKVVEDSAGVGGDIDGLFVIKGTVTGNITVPHAAGLSFEGTFGDIGGSTHTLLIDDITAGDVSIAELNDASIIVLDIIDNGDLDILLNATNDSHITIEEMDTDARLRVGPFATAGGNTADVTVWIKSDLPSGAEVDARNIKWLDGGLTIGNLSTVGDLAGIVRAYEADITMGMLNLGGTLDITTDLGGLVHVFGSLQSKGLIDVGGDLTSDINIEDDHSGGIDITGDTGALSEILIEGRVAGGRIDVGGVIDGDITIHEDTSSRSSIYSLGGLSGTITVNASEGDFNAAGDIYFGPNPPPGTLSAITYDGCIEVLDDLADGSDGDLGGDITVVGCHATTADLGLNVAGATNGTTSITQTGCANTVVFGACP